jgi:mannitol-specific phosphotransferase system IIBC component
MTYHILGNALTGLTVILSSGVMFTMLNKLFTVGSSSDTVDTSLLNLSKNYKKSTGICFLMSIIFIASKNITLPTLRMNMKAHRDALTDQKEVFRDTQDSISKHRRLREHLKKTKRTSRVKRLSYAIHEVKNNKKRHQINNFSKSKKHKSFRRRIPLGLFSRKM